MKGLRGLSYPTYQEDRLKHFLNKNTGMQILIHVDALSKDGDTITFKSRRYEVLNTDDITDVMTKLPIDIETQIENTQLSKSNIVIENISNITINYDIYIYIYVYNPTRAGSYVKLPEWLSSTQHVSTLKHEDQTCCKYCVQCSVV